MENTFFREIREKEKRMTPQEEAPLFLAAQSGCSISHQQLIYNHARFAIYEASKFMNPLHETDLIQVSMIGLSEAIKTFDPWKGFKFISYAVWYIKKEVNNYIHANLNLIRIPAKLSEGHSYASSFSYDAIEESLYDSIFSNCNNSIYNDLEEENERRKNQIELLLTPLKKSQREVIMLRLTTDMTFGEIGKHFGYTGENARQYFFHGVAKLKKLYKKEELIQLFY